MGLILSLLSLSRAAGLTDSPDPWEASWWVGVGLTLLAFGLAVRSFILKIEVNDQAVVVVRWFGTQEVALAVILEVDAVNYSGFFNRYSESTFGYMIRLHVPGQLSGCISAPPRVVRQQSC